MRRREAELEFEIIDTVCRQSRIKLLHLCDSILLQILNVKMRLERQLQMIQNSRRLKEQDQHNNRKDIFYHHHI